MLRKKEIAVSEQILNLINECNLYLTNDNFYSFSIYHYLNGKKQEYAYPTILGFLDICFYCLFGQSVDFIYGTNMLGYDKSMAGKSLYEQTMEPSNKIVFGERFKL